MNISEHITYREATFSRTAIKKGILNTPNVEQLAFMHKIGMNLFEPLRLLLGGKALWINSFFRCDALNKVVGGSPTSQHLCDAGAAIDIDNDNNPAGPSNKDIFYCIKNNLTFDQLIWEYGDNNSPDWVHVSYWEGHNRKEVLRCVNGHYMKMV
jgi:hypothetical protein